MVGWLLKFPGLAIDLHRLEPVASLWRAEQVVDSDPVILLEGAALIVPKRVLMRPVVG